jgi:LysM repeat protein
VRVRIPANRATRRWSAAALVVVAGAVGLADAGRHTVQPGETASEIARDHGTTLAALVAANGLGNPDLVVAGQVLVIPGAGAVAVAPATTIHTVAAGESLGEIARQYGTTTRALAEANGISNPNLVRIGQRLTVPAGGGSGGSGASAPAPTVHTVAAGESLGEIAGRYGTTTRALAEANGISNPNLVRIGQRLTVPAGSGGGSAPSSTSAYDGTGGADGRTGVPGTHTVVRGDTLVGIASRYGVDPLDLAAANGLLRPHNVFANARYRLDAGNRIPTDLANCPVPGATYVNDWGFPRSGGRAHEGNDLFAPKGTPVLAPVAGTVSYSTGVIGGRQFRLLADDGTLYIGSHMDAFGETGRVAAGAVVGAVGDSGNAAGSRPHLHFEVHPDSGVAMNPYPLVRLACG